MSEDAKPPSKAMTELLGPIVGITLVLMSVFIPASLLPGRHPDACSPNSRW